MIVDDNLIFVEGSTFTMGCNNNDGKDPAEEPEHEVKVSDFYISKYPITVFDYSKFIQATNYKTFAEKDIWKWTKWEHKWSKKVNWKCNELGGIRPKKEWHLYPVIHLSWVDAMEYCEWLSKKNKKTYRLPTEAEWEFAAIGGVYSKGHKYSGSNLLSDVGWFKDTGGIAPPFPDENIDIINYKPENMIQANGLKKPNELGLFDMSGNIWEWCYDWYYENFYSESPVDNPIKLDLGNVKSMRGGCWYNYAANCRNTSRAGDGIHDWPDDCGFRIVKLT